MDRRMFLQLAPALLGSDELPKYKVVSHHEPSKNPEMPGPYRGVVARVHSEHVIDPASEHIDQPSVDKMLSAGIRALTGAKADKEAWASFFTASDVVGIKVNCSGAPVIRASPEVVGGIIRNLVSVGVRPGNYLYIRAFPGPAHRRPFLSVSCPQACGSWRSRRLPDLLLRIDRKPTSVGDRR